MEKTHDRFKPKKVLCQQKYVSHTDNMNIIRSLPIYKSLSLREPKNNDLQQSLLFIKPEQNDQLEERIVNIYMDTYKNEKLSRYYTKNMLTKSLIDFAPDGITQDSKQDVIKKINSDDLYTRLYPRELTDEDRKIHQFSVSLSQLKLSDNNENQISGKRPIQRKAKYVSSSLNKQANE